MRSYSSRLLIWALSLKCAGDSNLRSSCRIESILVDVAIFRSLGIAMIADADFILTDEDCLHCCVGRTLLSAAFDFGFHAYAIGPISIRFSKSSSARLPTNGPETPSLIFGKVK